MKIYLQFLVFLIFCFYSCSTTNEPINDIEFEVLEEDMVNNYSIPSEGVFYEYQFSGYRDNISNVEEVLRDYIRSGVKLQDAWYKNGSSNCYPPNSQIVMHVIVEPNFLIRTINESNLLIENNFIKVEKPSHFSCGYSVKHFIPKSD